MQVWNMLHAARWQYRTQKVVKKSPSVYHHTSLSGYIFATKAHIDNWKKRFKQQYLLHMFPQYRELRPTAEIDPVVWGTTANFNGLASWQRYCTARQYWTSAKLCGVDQRAPPIFGRATIMLGICPHSSLICVLPLWRINVPITVSLVYRSSLFCMFYLPIPLSVYVCTV